MIVLPNATFVEEPTLTLIEEFETAYTPHDAIWINGNQEMIDQAVAEYWSGNGSASSPYIITGYSFIQDTQPLRIWHADLYWIFTGNQVDGDGQDVECGTWIDDVENGVITDNVFMNRHSGMVVMDVTNVNITNNVVHDCSANGIEAMGMMTECLISGNTVYNHIGSGLRFANGVTNCTIVDNTITDCTQMGINVMGACHDSVLSENTVTNTGLAGVMVSMSHNSVMSFNTITNSSDNGLELMGADNVEIYNNSISQIDEIGIDLTYCDLSSIYDNTITTCTGNGLYAQSGENTSILSNRIQDCDDYAVHLDVDVDYYEVKYNAFIDNGVDCQLCDGSTGSVILNNYYSDWNTPDVDSNGFVDIAYQIDGDTANEDALPLAVMGVVPNTDPTTTSPPPSEPLAINQLLLGCVAAVVIVLGIGVVLRRRGA
jgi:parallel beta-helix repeat protein